MSNYIYESGVVSAKENEFIPKEAYNKMQDATSISKAISILTEYGVYNKYANRKDFDVFLNEECQSLVDFIKIEAPDEDIMAFFVLTRDLNNIIIACKAEIMNISPDEYFSLEGNFSFNVIKKNIKTKNYANFNNNLISSALNEFFQKFNEGKLISPSQIDFYLKKLKYRVLLKSIKTNLVKKLVKLTIDCENISLILRTDKSSPIEFLEGGNIKLNTLKLLKNRDRVALLDIQKNMQSIVNLIFVNKSDRVLQNFEILRSEILLKVIDCERNNIESSAPFIYFVLRKQMEIKNIRLILSFKNSNISDKVSSRVLLGEL